MWCRGSKGTGIDAADERAAHTTEPVQSDHRIVGMTLKKKKTMTHDCFVQIMGSVMKGHEN